MSKREHSQWTPEGVRHPSPWRVTNGLQSFVDMIKKSFPNLVHDRAIVYL